MTIHRFHVPPGGWEGDRVILSPEQSRQVRKVLRLTDGAALEVFDGAGRCAGAVLTGERRADCLCARVVGAAPVRGELRAPLFLLQALLRGDKNDLLVEKATELGVTGIHFWLAARCVSRPEPHRLEARLARWRRIAAEAAEQCGRSFVPEVRCGSGLRDLLLRLSGDGVRVLLAYESERRAGLLSLLGDGCTGGVAIALGPEGGIAPEELACCAACGVPCVTLGSRTLRAETAALAALALAASALEPEVGTAPSVGAPLAHFNVQPPGSISQRPL